MTVGAHRHGHVGGVVPNLGYSNLAREAWLDAKLDPTVPTSTVIMQCSTSMMAAFDLAGLLARGNGNGLTYEDVHLWELHEAFSAQVLYQLKALDSPAFVKDKAGVSAALGVVPRDRINPHGGSVALGHPFGATGARILSQAIKELAALRPGSRAIVSICADGGVGTVALLET